MKRPSTISYVVGNPISVELVCVLTSYLTYEWWIGVGSGFFAIVGALIAINGMNANSRLTRYGQWKREWDAMEGRTSSTMPPWFSTRLGRFLIGIPVWCGCAYLALTVGNDPGGRVGAGLFWLATFAGIIGGIMRWRRMRKPARPSAGKDVPVVLCVKRPDRAPDISQAYRALPAYCAALLHRPEVEPMSARPTRMDDRSF